MKEIYRFKIINNIYYVNEKILDGGQVFFIVYVFCNYLFIFPSVQYIVYLPV